MATALIKGLLAGNTPATSISVSDPDTAKVRTLCEENGIAAATDNIMLAAQADIIVLAVKPQVMEDVVKPLAATLAGRGSLLLSVAAGLPLARFSAWTHESQAVVRCMPNTPALVGIGASALFANAACSDRQKQQAAAILDAVGETVWLQSEAQMDAVTALSGSGPAYFFLLIEAMQAAATELGLPADMAQRLALQTALGSATLAKQGDVDAAELRRRVTSPGGTTEAALKQFDTEDFRGMVSRALAKAANRSRELAG